MKTKQIKEEPDKSIDEETISEPKTRGRKKASDVNEEDKLKAAQDEPKTSKDPKKNLTKPKAVVKKRPLDIKKTLRSKKVVITKEKLKNVIKQGAKRGRKPNVKPSTPQEIKKEEEAVPLIPASEIKTEPVDEPASTSRSSSPKTAGRRVRLTSDLAMMKSVLGDSLSSLVHGTRTSPYSMRSERSNSPSTIVAESKKLRSIKPRKAKTNLLNEVVMKAQHKRRRLLSDSKATDSGRVEEKKLKRERSCSRDGSEISKCSDITESDISLSETPSTDVESKELNKKLYKPKTDLDVDIENNLSISAIEQVPSLNVDSKTDSKQDPESTSTVNIKNKKKLSLKKSSLIDSDNNNSSRVIESLNNTLEDKTSLLLRTENDTLLNDRFSILSCMSKTFNSREVSKNIRKARRGKGKKAMMLSRRASAGAKPAPTSTVTAETMEDDKVESIDSLSKEISDLITNLDQAIDNPHDTETTENASTADPMTKSVSKFYGLSKPLCDNNIIMSAPETPVKEKEQGAESTPSKNDDSENIRLHYDEDSADKPVESRHEITYKCNTVASIDKLMDRLKEFEEFDKKRQRQESESKPSEEFNKQVMVSNDVVLINKSGADIRPLKDVQSVRSPEKPIEKENVLSCFENNSAISIVKRDQVRRSIDLDLPNSVTLIKRNSISRKESTGSNHSRESTDAISIFEKSLGRDVTLTEIRKSVDKSSPASQVEIHQFATLHPNKPNLASALDTKEISITPFVTCESKTNDVAKRGPKEATSRKCSETNETDIEKIATMEKMKSPTIIVKSPLILSPVAVKSPETQPIETEPLAPPLVNIITPPEDVPMTTETAVTAEVAKTDEVKVEETIKAEDQSIPATLTSEIAAEVKRTMTEKPNDISDNSDKIQPMEVQTKTPEIKPEKITKTISTEANELTKIEQETDSKISETAEVAKPGKSPEKPEKIPVKLVKSQEKPEKSPEKPENSPEKQEKGPEKPEKGPEKIEKGSEKTEKIPEKPEKISEKPRKISTENKPGPSNAIVETPESQKRKESVLRTLGLLTHKAANEAKLEKAKEKERLYGGMLNAKNKAKSGDYTGTLKTVIKLNRGERDRKKFRSSLKMTFKHRGKMTLGPGDAADNDEAYYTIERREGCASTTEGGHRKSHYSNRLNNDPEQTAEAVAEPAKEATLNLVIPEKASSFSIHPGRLCMDQCFYCGGKFGLFDTPCHIAQMKSSERQRKVLANEEKLTIDSCLCDACYRHVDRRANCPSYRKRPLKPPHTAGAPALQTDLRPATSPGSSGEEAGRAKADVVGADMARAGGVAGAGAGGPGRRAALCHTEGCAVSADRCIRRKWLIKMRSSVNKVLKLQGDYPGLHTIPLCAAHYARLAPLQACKLCGRRLTKHHYVHFIHHGFAELNPRLSSLGIPVQFSERPVLCKPCRLYCALLARDDPAAAAAPSQRAHHYTARLLRIHNVEVLPEFDETQEINPTLEENNTNDKQKKKTKTKSKRKSTDPDKPGEMRERTSESSHDDKMKEESNDSSKQNQTVEDDIENLISSNKIMVPNAKINEPNVQTQSDGSSSETHMDIDTPHLPLDKQTELQYLLQKQNNPAQFLPKPTANLTLKQKSIVKTLPGIQKPGLQHRIHDKNSKRIHKLGQIITQTEKCKKDDEELSDPEKIKEGLILKNISLNEECTIESIPNKKPADITTLKNKWQMSESFTQVQKNLSQLSKKLTIEKSTKKPNDPKYSNPVKRLETNPSISVRELFPGEEEMNLQCIVEFNNVKGVTPEGWEKCTSTIQYDLETKRLWSELQKPYGNQSSFLRHLVLLEKYFRSGDLVLAQNASINAANYSDSVQSRLRAFDNVASDAPRRAEPSISLIEFRKQKPSVNGKSLLKTSQDKEKKAFMPPPIPKLKPKEKKTKQLPPELIAINTPNAQGRSAIQNVLHNIQQLVKGVSASDPTEVAAAPLPFLLAPPAPPAPLAVAPRAGDKPPKSDTPKKTKTTSKPWRPTLMPITPENVARIAREPPQTAVDGRSLPSLVQVMSSGKRYHITLQDYNKMCIMRREKLQQLQDGETKKTSVEPETLITEIHPSTMLGNGGTMTQNIDKKQDSDRIKTEMNELGNAATILKNVGLKNITIAPIPAKTATVTSITSPLPTVSSPSLIVSSTPIKIPQLGPAVSITSETILSPSLSVASASVTSMTPMIMPKIPKSLTVIPQTVLLPQSIPSVASIVPVMQPVDGQMP